MKKKVEKRIKKQKLYKKDRIFCKKEKTVTISNIWIIL